jgi:hypothetical protein
VKLSIPPLPPVAAAILILGPYGLIFLAATLVLRVEGGVNAVRMALRR